MAIKIINFGGAADFTAGDVLKAADLKDTFLVAGIPIGGITQWLKTFSNLETGTTTSVSANKLIDTGATFQTNLVKAGMTAHVYFYDATNYATSSLTFATLLTITLSSDSSKGFYIRNYTNEMYASGGCTIHTKATFYYTDATTQSVTNTSNLQEWTAKTFANPSPTKKVWKILIEGTTANASYANYNRYNEVNFAAEYDRGISGGSIDIVSVDSETQLTLSADLILNTGLQYRIYATPILPAQYVECNGQTLSDSDSLFDGATIPALNGFTDATKTFLRGAFKSGATGGSDTHTHTTTISAPSATTQSVYAGTGAASPTHIHTVTVGPDSVLPVYYEVVMIMRVK